MFYRLLGKFFFLFYICPRIAREFRVLRKWLNPVLNEVIVDTIKKTNEDLAKSKENHPAGSRRSE